jgi:hypothetical protein
MRDRRQSNLPPARRCQTMAWLLGGTVVPGASTEDSTRIGTFR